MAISWLTNFLTLGLISQILRGCEEAERSSLKDTINCDGDRLVFTTTSHPPVGAQNLKQPGEVKCPHLQTRF